MNDGIKQNTVKHYAKHRGALDFAKLKLSLEIATCKLFNILGWESGNIWVLKQEDLCGMINLSSRKLISSFLESTSSIILKTV